MTELRPLDVKIEMIALHASSFTFQREVDHSGKRMAQVVFGVTPARRDGKNLLSLTTYEVTLENDAGEPFAEIRTEFLALLTSREDLPENLEERDNVRIEVAAAEAAHFHHRALIARLTGDAGIRPYNLPTAFRREDLSASLAGGDDEAS